MSQKQGMLPAKPIKELNDTHRMLADLRGAGWSVKRCLQQLDIGMGVYRSCMATEEWQDLLAERKRQFVQRVIQDKLEDPARSAVKEAVPVAVERAKRIIEYGEDEQANKAIKTILDVGVGAKVEHSKSVTGVQINITQNQHSDLDELESRMGERERTARKIGLRSDRGAIEVSEVQDDT